MYRLYKKNVLNFSLAWIIACVVLLSAADSLSVSLGFEKIITAPVSMVFALLMFFHGEPKKLFILYSAWFDDKR